MCLIKFRFIRPVFNLLNRRHLLQQTMLSCGLITIGSPAAWAKGLPPVPANQNADTGLQTLMGP